MVPERKFELVPWICPDGSEMLGRHPDECPEHDKANRALGRKPKDEPDAEEAEKVETSEVVPGADAPAKKAKKK